GAKSLLQLLLGAPALHLCDHDQPLGALTFDGDRGDTAAADLLRRRLDVVGIMVAAVDDQQIFDAADDEQLAVVNDAQISCPKPRPQRRAGRWIDELAA